MTNIAVLSVHKNHYQFAQEHMWVQIKNFLSHGKVSDSFIYSGFNTQVKHFKPFFCFNFDDDGSS